MKTLKKVEDLFVEKTEDGKTHYVLNDQLKLSHENAQEGAQYLVEAIRYWHKKRRFFCHDQIWDSEKTEDGKEKKVYRPEDDWKFNYKTPSTCNGCVSGQRILDKIFGDRGRFNSLPFVKCLCERSYSFPFDLLKYYADNGHEATVQLMEERKQEASCKKAEAERQRKQQEGQKAKFARRFSGVEISDELCAQIMKYADNSSLVIVDKDIALVQDYRSEYGSSGGIGYYDQIRIFYGSQSDMREWQYRDRYSAIKDRYDLSIDSIGEVEVTQDGGKVTVKVELVNRQYKNRFITFTFDQIEVAETVNLTTAQQIEFLDHVNSEILRIIVRLERLWDCKPLMPSTSGYTSYRRPSIKQKEICPEIGVAAFVTEEQIDNRGSDPQIRYELFVLTYGADKAECITENHGYGREGGALLAVLDLNAERVIINTKSGKSTISLKNQRT